MKKVILLAAIVLNSITASAQNYNENEYLPDGIFTLEWKFNPFDYEGKPTNMAQLNARMFLDEQNAIRFGVGIGFDRDRDEQSTNFDSRSVNSSNYEVRNSTTTIINKELSLKLALGYEFHFAHTGRLDFYAGAEAGYLGRFYSASKETEGNNQYVAPNYNSVSNTFDNYEYEKSNADRTKFNENGFFGTIFTGVDFYVYRKLYIGAELGLTFNTGKKANGKMTIEGGKTETENGSQKINETYKYSSDTGLRITLNNINKTYRYEADEVKGHEGTFTKLYIEPAIRIGWMF